jgi:hypothetical protein
LFAHNSAPNGGAVRVMQGTVQSIVFSHCAFLDNSASNTGGAIQDIGASGFPQALNRTIEDCHFAGNVSGTDGGALYLFGVQSIRSCTLVDNRAGGKGGALYVNSSSNITVLNSILWGNSATQGAQIHMKASLSVAFSDVQGGQAQVSIQAGGLNWGAGNIDLNPSFVDPDGLDNNPLTVLDNDYRLSGASPCIDAGANSSIGPDLLDIDGDGNTIEPMPLDLDLGARRVDVIAVPDTGAGTAPLVDMGAYERPG